MYVLGPMKATAAPGSRHSCYCGRCGGVPELLLFKGYEKSVRLFVANGYLVCSVFTEKATPFLLRRRETSAGALCKNDRRD